MNPIKAGVMDAIRGAYILNKLGLKVELETSSETHLTFKCLTPFLDIVVLLSSKYGDYINASDRSKALKRVYWKVPVYDGVVFLEQLNSRPCMITFRKK